MNNKYNMDDKFKVDDKQEKKDDEIEVLDIWEPHADEITDAKDRHIKFSKKTTNRIVIVLVALGALLLMWYSTFAQPLASNNQQYKDEHIYIGFTNTEILSIVGSAKEVNKPDISARDEANFYVSLSNIGDKIVYDLTIENRGNMDAKVDDIRMKPENKDGDAILYYLSGIKEGDVLPKGSIVHVQLTVTYQNAVQVAGVVRKDLTVNIDYVQA